MSDSQDTASAEASAPPKPVVLWGHNYVVYTWPMLVAAIILVIFHILEVPEQVGQWIFAISTCIVLTTLGLDIKPATFFVMLLIIFLVGLLGGVVYWLGEVNLFWLPWKMIDSFGPFGLVILWLVMLWFYDYVHAWLWERYIFDNGQVRHKRVIGPDEVWLAEQCNADIHLPDAFEFALWGADLEIANEQKQGDEGNMLIKNVFRSQSAFERILPHLPRDRSNRGI